MAKTPQSMIDALARVVFGGVSLTSVALSRASDGRDLTFRQWWAIVIVGESADGCRVGEVARRMGASIQATSRLLRRLEGRGLLSLTRDESDRRATVARPTPEGSRFLVAVLSHRRALLAELAHGIDPSTPADEVLDELAGRLAAKSRSPRGVGAIDHGHGRDRSSD